MFIDHNAHAEVSSRLLAALFNERLVTQLLLYASPRYSLPDFSIRGSNIPSPFIHLPRAARHFDVFDISALAFATPISDAHRRRANAENFRRASCVVRGRNRLARSIYGADPRPISPTIPLSPHLFHLTSSPRSSSHLRRRVVSSSFISPFAGPVLFLRRRGSNLELRAFSYDALRCRNARA